jgi:hypothetical protein
VLDDSFIKRASLVGEFDSPTSAIDQPRIQARLKPRDRFADTGLRHAEPFGGPPEAACVGDGSED